VSDRNAIFNTFRKSEPLDPSPHALTPAEREHVDDRLRSGQYPRTHLIRKMLRLLDEREARIRELERGIREACQ
jgi:hypothetical protein